MGLDVSTSATSTNNGGAGFRFNNGASLYDTSLDAENFHIVAWQVDPGQTYADATLYVDGTLPENIFSGSSNSPTGTASFTGSNLELILGTGRSGGGGLLTTDMYSGQLAELLVFNEQLDIGQMNLVANYLSSEYNLPFAYQTNFDIFSVDGLAWVGSTGSFDSHWNSGDGNRGLAANNTNPFASGDANLYLANDGSALFDATTDASLGNRINSLRVGTAGSGLLVADTEGSGELIVNDNVSLIIGSGAAPSTNASTGDLTIGEDGFGGTVTWNSTGTLKVEGKFRIGQGGTGLLVQNSGVVTAGDVAGSLKFVAIGNGVNSSGTYQLNEGEFLPGGGPSGSQLRHLRVGYNGATGLLEVGDGIGSNNSAVVATTDDLYIGYDGGNGTLRLHSDAYVQLQGNEAPVLIGINANSVGHLIQEGGLFESDGLFVVGQGIDAVGIVEVTAGQMIAAGDGTATLSIGSNGGHGTFRVSGSGQVTSNDTMILANGSAGTVGRLEMIGSSASIITARLENVAQGGSEIMRWEADTNGITSLVVTGTTSSSDVQLQALSELSGNTGTNGPGTLHGDGTALELDLSAITATQQLMLIDNQTTEAIVGYFENGETGELYEEGEQLQNTGFVGSVTISYLGGDGNDVVLSLLAGVAGDYNNDGIVNLADYTVWRDHFGDSPDSIPNRSIELWDTPIGMADYQTWKANFGQTLTASSNASNVPEPSGGWLLGLTMAVLGLRNCGKCSR
ncbi:hypothetical protein [Aeoliella mucimassa]|uniref:Uncharacterized protein n=1 Tax=Aeoliella mucimassa TaxID=2527972 RepID=A0A518APE5_9BACT|nr:hypothetical protein [Aeoliella mucimassa]QDU56595.1 hypothetical protein Pan181_28050 [Aeoliella mucimassa]